MSISSLFVENGYDLRANSLDVKSLAVSPPPAPADDAEALLAVNPLGANLPLVTMRVGEGVTTATFTFLTYPGVPPGALPPPITGCPVNYIRLGRSCVCNVAIFPFPATSGSFTGTLTLPLAREEPFASTVGELLGTVTSTDNENTVRLFIDGREGSTNLAEIDGNVTFASGGKIIFASFSYSGVP